MKVLNELLKAYQNSPEKGGTVELLIRRGKVKPLVSPRSVSEMKCADCGNAEGHTCSHDKQIAWFCASLPCLQIDAAITKAKDLRIWWERHLEND